VLNKRAGEETEEYRAPGGNAAAVAEAARSASESGKAGEAQGDEKVSLFWRVFGGTILSMLTLGAITLYNNIASNIAELRAELNREREARAELVKKDEFNSRTTTQYERIRSFETVKAEIEGLKERANANAAAIDGLKKDTGANLDALRKDVGAAADAVKKDGAALDVLKEKLAAAAADLKALRDDSVKVQQEVDRNRVADLERKTSRDAQHKQFEEILKELQKGLQDCREKLARLEGARTPEPKGTTPPKADSGGGG
jgi:hypothetical protein